MRDLPPTLSRVTTSADESLTMDAEPGQQHSVEGGLTRDAEQCLKQDLEPGYIATDGQVLSRVSVGC